MLKEFYFENNYLTPDECQLFIDHYKENEEQSYRCRYKQPPHSYVNLNRRICMGFNIKDKGNDKLAPIIDRITQTVKTVNEEQYLFDIDWESHSRNKMLTILKYDGAEKAFWSRHQHVNWISNDKQFKIHVSINLSEANSFEGGDHIWFFASHVEKPTPAEQRQQGLLTVLPAFRAAQVNPVLTGTKYTLELLFEGPYWR